MIRSIKGNIKVGDSVDCILDEKRRNKLTRMHTAEHILFKSLQTVAKDVQLEKICLGEEESSLFVKSDFLNWERLLDAEEFANRIIKEKRIVREFFVPKEEIDSIKELRIKKERIKADKIRIIEIEGFDRSACTGTHCGDTSEIGFVYVTGFNACGRSMSEIRFVINDLERVIEDSRVARLVSGVLNKETKSIVAEVNQLIKKVDEMKERIRAMSVDAASEYKQESVNGINVVYNMFKNLEKKQLIDQARKLVNENTVVCFANEMENGFQMIILISKDLELDAAKLLNSFDKSIGIVGGGRDKFLMISFAKDKIDDVFSEIKRIISKYNK